MNVDVTIMDGPLEPSPRAWRTDGAGAVICFDGIVRPTEADQPIAGLRYQTYDPMAEQELRRLAEHIVMQFKLIAVHVEHSRGFVPNRECSFRLRIASAHRKEGLAAMDMFIDRMKQDVPIWKTAVPVEAASGAAR